MCSIETESRRIKIARNKSGKITIIAIIWLIFIEEVAAAFGLGRFFVIVTVVPMVLYWANVAKSWMFSFCPICKKLMFRKFLISISIFKCVHCGYDLKNKESSNYRNGNA